MSINAYIFILGACFGMAAAFLIDDIYDRELRKDDEYECQFLYEVIKVQNEELAKYMLASKADKE